THAGSRTRAPVSLPPAVVRAPQGCELWMEARFTRRGRLPAKTGQALNVSLSSDGRLTHETDTASRGATSPPARGRVASRRACLRDRGHRDHDGGAVRHFVLAGAGRPGPA